MPFGFPDHSYGKLGRMENKKNPELFYLSNNISKTGSDWPIQPSFQGMLSGQGIEVRGSIPPYSSRVFNSSLLPSASSSPETTSYLLFKKKAVLLIYEYLQ